MYDKFQDDNESLLFFAFNFMTPSQINGLQIK